MPEVLFSNQISSKERVLHQKALVILSFEIKAGQRTLEVKILQEKNVSASQSSAHSSLRTQGATNGALHTFQLRFCFRASIRVTHLKNSFMGELFFYACMRQQAMLSLRLKQQFASAKLALKRLAWHIYQMFLSPSAALLLLTFSLHTETCTTHAKSLHHTCHWRAIWSDCRWFFRQMPLVFLAHTSTPVPSKEITSTTQLAVLPFESWTDLARPPWHNCHFLSN